MSQNKFEKPEDVHVDQVADKAVDKMQLEARPPPPGVQTKAGSDAPGKLSGTDIGYYIECNRSSTAADWAKITAAVDSAEKQGKVPFVETWPDAGQGRDEVDKMLATMTLVMTHAPDGYALFADPDGANKKKEHLHDWNRFYDTDAGKATGARQDYEGSSRREFSNGTVIYNPLANKSVDVTFKEPRTSAATGKSGLTFVVNPEDGNIFLK